VIRTGKPTFSSTLTRITANQLPGTVIFCGTRTCQPGATVDVGVEVDVGVAVDVGRNVADGVKVAGGEAAGVGDGRAVAVATGTGTGITTGGLDCENTISVIDPAGNANEN
jgi:hypothetical protein